MGLKGATNEEKIWNFLIEKGFNAYGVAGLMGNLYAESGLRSDNLQNTYEKKLGYNDAGYTSAVDSGAYNNFVRDSAGYGLAQWTYWSRKQNLLNYAKSVGKSIGDLEMQLGFLYKELSEGYKSLCQLLKSATSVKDASTAVLTQFERPANQSESAKNTRASYGQKYYDKYSKTETKKETKTMSKISTAAELAERAIDAAKNHKTLYVMGGIGYPLNERGKQRSQNNSWNTTPDRKAFINAATDDTFAFDCVCFIKSLLWGWRGDKTKTYGGAEYESNGVPDIGADTMITRCSDVSTDFSKISVGEAVWMQGHIGIYVGNGLAVECTPAWANKVQITACNCTKSGYNRRNWTKHGKLPYVKYEAEAAPVVEPAKPADTSLKFKVGDIVNFTGKTHYKNANAATGTATKASKAKITAVSASGKHPYHCRAVNDGGAFVGGVYGWVNAADVSAISVPKPAATSAKSVDELAKEVINGKWGNGEERKKKLTEAGYDYAEVQSKVNELCAAPAKAAPWTPAIGDKVNYKGKVHYKNANAPSGYDCRGGLATITAIYQLGKSKHPYHLVKVSGSGATVYGWVDAGTFEKA